MENEWTEQPTATRRIDCVSHITWLEFDARPSEQLIERLKANGWRWSGYRKQWRSNARWPTVPAGVIVADGGECDYASERAARLETSAERHEAISDDAYNRSHNAVAHIPLGQPILVGHHSERRHRADLARSHRAMDKSVAEQKIAEDLYQRAQSSARHQARKLTPAAMARRADRLDAEHRAMVRNIERRAVQLDRDGMAETEGDRLYREHAADVAAEVERLRAVVAAAGGLLADRVEVHVGDIIRIRGFIGRVARINPKTYSVEVTRGWTLKLEKSFLQAIVSRAGERGEGGEPQPPLPEA